MYDWTQTNTSLTISIPIPYRVEKKKVDFVITESYIKLNIIEMKKIYFIDLAEKVDIFASKMVIEENKILFVLAKVKEELWKDLEFKGTKEEKRQRRKEADEKYNEKVKQERELAEKKKIEFEKFVTEQSIKIDDDKRNLIRSKKDFEKTQAENELYNFIDKIDGNHDHDEDDHEVKEPEPSLHQQHEEEEISTAMPTLETVKPKPEEKAEPRLLQPQPVQPKNDIIKPKKQDKVTPTPNSFQKAQEQIMNHEEHLIKKEPPKPVNPATQAQIRQQSKINVNLTEKKIPTFAARESLSKEPPYPKSKKYVPEKNYVSYINITLHSLAKK